MTESQVLTRPRKRARVSPARSAASARRPRKPPSGKPTPNQARSLPRPRIPATDADEKPAGRGAKTASSGPSDIKEEPISTGSKPVPIKPESSLILKSEPRGAGHRMSPNEGRITKKTSKKRKLRPTAASASTKEQQEEKKTGTKSNHQVTLHECSFLKPHVAGLTAIAASRNGCHIAISKTDGSLELHVKTPKTGRTPSGQPATEWSPRASIPAESGSPDLSISRLIFTPCDGYLVAARLDGSITLYGVDVERDGLTHHVTVRPGGGAVWDLAFDVRVEAPMFRLAVACDDGCVRFIRPDASFLDMGQLPTDAMHYFITMSERTSARVLSVAWAVDTACTTSAAATGSKGSTSADATPVTEKPKVEKPANSSLQDEDEEMSDSESSHTKTETEDDNDEPLAGIVVCGDSEGGVRWLDATTGRVIGRGWIAPLRKTPVLLWTICSTRGGSTIICGDDRGLVTVWSSRTFTLESEISIQGLQGSIWCSASAQRMKHGRPCGDDEDVVMLGAANGGVGGLRVAADERTAVVPLRASLMHSHDVRDVAVLPDGRFATAAIDGRVAILRPECLVEKRVPVEWPVMVDGIVSQPVVQVVRRQSVVVSRGSRDVEFWKVGESEGGHEGPVNVLRMRLKSIGCDIRAVACSADGEMVAVSTGDEFKFYRIWDGIGVIGSCVSFGKVEVVKVDDKIEGILYGCVDMVVCGGCVVGISRCRRKVIVFAYGSGNVRQFSMQEVGSQAGYLTRVACGGHRVVVCDSRGSAFERVVSSEEETARWQVVCEATGNARMVTAVAVSMSGEHVALAYDDRRLVKVVMREGVVEKVHRPVMRFHSIVNSVSFSEDEQNLLVSGVKVANVASLAMHQTKSKKGSNGATASWKFFGLDFFGCLWGSCVLGVGRAALFRRRLDVVETYLPDAIPKKKFGG